MMLRKIILQTVVIAVLLFSFLGAHGEANLPSWEKDWPVFAKYISPYLLKVKIKVPSWMHGIDGLYGASLVDYAELNRLIDGHAVTWIGQVKDIEINNGVAKVTLNMPPQAIAVQPEASAVLHFLQITSTNKDECSSWQNVKRGNWVRFRTTIKSSSNSGTVSLMTGLGNHEGEWAVSVSTSGGSLIELMEKPANINHPYDLLPSLTKEVSGGKPVRVRNPNDFFVAVGVRNGSDGINFMVPPNGVRTIFVPEGKYEIYFVYSSEPTALFQGDSFTLDSKKGVEIKLVKVVNGNYGIRRVK